MKINEGRGPAYRIETERLVLRCMGPEDAPAFHRVVEANVEHLRPWLSWVRHEPQPLQERVRRLQQLRSHFDRGKDYIYGIFDPRESQVLGATGLQTRQGPGTREVSYWIDRDHCGRGLATEVAGALVRVAFEVDRVRRVELHCDPRNRASAVIARRLGFEHEATLKARRYYGEGAPGDTMIWTLFEDTYRRSPARDMILRAFDGLGRQVL